MANVALQRGGVFGVKDLISPVGGINSRDARSAMSETDAIELINWFPTPTGLISRNGSSSFCTGLGSAVHTLAEYHAGGTRKFLAAAGSAIYEISTGTASSVGSGYSSAKWQWTNFNGYMHLVNGVDAPQKYSGSTLSASGWTGTGLTPANLVGVHAYKGRLYYWENASQDFWYGDVNAITGTLTKFPLSRVGQKGGNLVAIKSITRDGGSGADDVIAFFMSSGTVIIYSGGDPGDAADWSLQGVYTIGAPINARTLVEIKGDVLVLTKNDAISLLSVMVDSGFNNKPSKLSGKIAEKARTYNASFGWQALLHPEGNMIIFNVPIIEGSKYIQYIQNSITGAFTEFNGWNGHCFGLYNGGLYYGGAGTVYRADYGTSDNNEFIQLSALQAFSYLGTKRNKRMSRYRVSIKASGNITINSGLAFDYGDVFVPQSATITQDGTEWDTSPWDTSPWSPEVVVQRKIFTASGTGKTVSMRFGAKVKSTQIEWFGTEFSYIPLNSF